MEQNTKLSLSARVSSRPSLLLLIPGILPVIALLLLSFGAIAQSSQTVRGVVTDKTSEKPLPGVTVIVAGTDPVIGTTTDTLGRYVLPAVPLGRHQLSFGSAGYHGVSIPEVLITAGKEVVLDVALEQRLVTLDAFTITHAAPKKGAVTNEFSAGSGRSFSPEDVNRYAGGRNDPSKLVSNYAGVAANSDARNDIVVRGNSPAGVLWRVEGSPSPSPNHFATLGTTGGPVSALNTNMLKTSDFLTGAFPAEYGNALAAVFDIDFRSGNSSRHEMTLQINAFSGFEADVEGPLNKKNNGAAYLATYRYGFAQVAQAVGINIGTKAVPYYQDWAFNVTTGKSPIGKFSFFGMGGLSHIALLGSKVDSTDFYGQADEDSYDKSNFSYFGVKNTLDIDSRTYLRTVVTYAYTLDDYDQYRYPDPVPPYADRWLNYSSHNHTSTLRYSSLFNRKVNSRLSYRIGASGENLGLDIHVYDKTARPATAPFDTVSNYTGAPFLLQYFGQFKYRFSEKFSVIGGLHGMHLGTNNSSAVEPRISATCQVAPTQSLSFSYGLHSQLQPLPVYFQTYDESDHIHDSTNKDLGFTRAQHFVLGYEWRFHPDWRLKAEAYYQYLYDVPVTPYPSGFSMLNAGADFGFPDKVGLVNKGTGTNKGVELTLERFLNHGYYLLVTGSLFDSKYKGSDGIERNTAFNYKYVTNILAGREWRISGNNAFTLDVRMSAIGGRYATPVNVTASKMAGYEIDDTLNYNSERLSDYFRLDMKFGYRTNSKKHRLSSTFYLDLQNITNRKNIFLLQYDQAKGNTVPVYQIRFFPDILYRLQF
jgi:hypothetical protein